MKRDEMVKILMSNSKVELEESVASYLLRFLENKGMLPPVDKEHFMESVSVQIEEEHRDNHGYTCGVKRMHYALRGATLALKTKWDDK